MISAPSNREGGRALSRAAPSGRRAEHKGWRAAAALLAVAAAGAARAEDGAVQASGCGPPSAGDRQLAGGDLTITYHGVSTLIFSDGADRLLVDGYFSRPGLLRTLLLPIGSHGKRVRDGLGAAAPPVRAVLTAHAHHDHALDAAAIAHLQDSAVVVGTPSVAKLVQDRGVPHKRVCAPADERARDFGPYRVTAFFVPHGPSPAVLRRLLDRPLSRRLGRWAWFGSYKDDRNLSFLIEHGGRRILVHPSAGTRDLTALGADTVFLGVGQFAGMEEVAARRYWDAVVGHRTRTVIPVHWDWFLRPPGEPLRAPPRQLDNNKAAFARLCRYAQDRPGLRVLGMDAHGGLTLQQNARPAPAGPVQLLCAVGGEGVRSQEESAGPS